MAGIDLPTLAAAGADAASRLPARKRSIPKAIRVAVDALTSGNSKTVSDAAEKAGITREYFSRHPRAHGFSPARDAREQQATSNENWRGGAVNLKYGSPSIDNAQ
jgi:hypothetical protein